MGRIGKSVYSIPPEAEVLTGLFKTTGTGSGDYHIYYVVGSHYGLRKLSNAF